MAAIVSGKLLPQIEEALLTMRPGDVTVKQVHFPIHYKFEPYRGKTITLLIELLDRKPYRLPPTIADEFFVGSQNGRAIDMMSLTHEQRCDLAEENPDGEAPRQSRQSQAEAGTSEPAPELTASRQPEAGAPATA